MLQRFLLWLLPYVLPMVVDLAHERNHDCYNRGRKLTDSEISIARAVGVREPGRVRLLLVDSIPPPKSFTLRHLAKLIGMDISKAQGITFIYGITIRKDSESLTILAHELRHVEQYEMFGVENFLDRYLREVITYGYVYSWPEVDAIQAADRVMR